MSAKLIATQVAGVTMGVIGAGLILNAVDKASRYGPNRLPVLDKINRLKGYVMEEPRFERAVSPVRSSLPEPAVRNMLVFDDNFATEVFEDYWLYLLLLYFDIQFL